MSGLGRILVIEDEPETRALLRDYLSGSGYSVSTAVNGADGLAAIHNDSPDLVLLDLWMPGINGLEVLRHMREHDPTVRVVIVTANEDVNAARETLELGATDYVAKPFDFGHLDQVILAALMSAHGSPGKEDEGIGTAFQALVLAVFRAARAMSGTALASTGDRMKTAALAAVRHAVAGELAAARQQLDELERLLALQSDLGDVGLAERGAIEFALNAARRAAATHP